MQMIVNIEFTRPDSFDNGRKYLFRERNCHGERRSIETVKFVDYTPCPAIVIIRIENGSIQRCLREDLFESRIVSRYLSKTIELSSSIRNYTTMVKTALAMFIQNLRIVFLNPAS
jgi:hypothetical protein